MRELRLNEQEDARRDEPLDADATLAVETSDNPLVETTSREYLGRWNHLVSTTNWEKGRIICQWREALVAAGAPPPCWSDEAWSRRVGGLTPQHAGRLRRVWQRFSAVREQWPGLYWSHFQAALDWSDAEMWLEGAMQDGWSVAQMLRRRNETLAELPAAEPLDASADDDVDDDAVMDETQPPEAISSSLVEVCDAGEDEQEDAAADSFAEPAAELVRPFASLPSLPADVQEAFEAFKLAIVRHRAAAWQEISQEDMLAVLESLREFALSPAVL